MRWQVSVWLVFTILGEIELYFDWTCLAFRLTSQLNRCVIRLADEYTILALLTLRITFLSPYLAPPLDSFQANIIWACLYLRSSNVRYHLINIWHANLLIWCLIFCILEYCIEWFLLSLHLCVYALIHKIYWPFWDIFKFINPGLQPLHFFLWVSQLLLKLSWVWMTYRLLNTINSMASTLTYDAEILVKRHMLPCLAVWQRIQALG